MDNLLVAVSIASLIFMLSASLGLLLGKDKDAEAALKIINETIAQCEESLPRDRHCEVVISAEVVGNE